jgi:hypothetical protein
MTGHFLTVRKRNRPEFSLGNPFADADSMSKFGSRGPEHPYPLIRRRKGTSWAKKALVG